MSIRPTGAFGLELGRQELLLNVRKAQGAGRVHECAGFRPGEAEGAAFRGTCCWEITGMFWGGSEPTCLGSEQLEVRLEKAEPAELGGCKPMQEALFPSVRPLPPHVS